MRMQMHTHAPTTMHAIASPHLGAGPFALLALKRSLPLLALDECCIRTRLSHLRAARWRAACIRRLHEQSPTLPPMPAIT